MSIKIIMHVLLSFMALEKKTLRLLFFPVYHSFRFIRLFVMYIFTHVYKRYRKNQTVLLSFTGTGNALSSIYSIVEIVEIVQTELQLRI